tara:strand:+ start:185 stop:394 length:210 start_codon:yes stop_codon:yes gene_type:complete
LLELIAYLLSFPGLSSINFIRSESNGQLGRALLISAPKNIDNNRVQIFKTTRSNLDHANEEECFSAVAD